MCSTSCGSIGWLSWPDEIEHFSSLRATVFDIGYCDGVYNAGDGGGSVANCSVCGSIFVKASSFARASG